MRYPRCHKCGTFDYLPGVKGTFKIDLHAKNTFNPNDRYILIKWEYCDCKAGKFLETHHDLLLSLVPDSEGFYKVPLKHGENLVRRNFSFPFENRFEVEQEYYYR